MIHEFCALLGIITQFCRIMLFDVFKGSIMSLEPYKRLAWKTNELSSKSLSKRLLSRFVRSKLEVAKLTKRYKSNQKLGKRGRSGGGEFWNCKSGSDCLCLRISPAIRVRIQEIWRQQRLEVQTFPAVATDS